MPEQRRIIFVLLALGLAALACTGSLADLEILPTSAPAEPSAAAGSLWYQLYFSDPGGPNAGSQRGGPDADLSEAIDAAGQSVALAVLDLNLWSIRDALIGAHQRGLQVRVVVDDGYFNEREVADLRQAGIPVSADNTNALMHHKFAVIDGVEVWTGSMNLTLNGAYHNDNHLIRLRSLELAQNYLTEFDEMFVSGLYGGLSAANTPYPVVTFSDAVIENYFSPDDGAEARIVELVEAAQTEVLFMAFAFTSDPIADALLEASLRGVRVQGVIESQQADNTGSDYYAFIDSGLDVRLDGNPAKMHHKVIVIDRSIVITGSYNFSRSASVRNDENLLVIFSPAVAARFVVEFERVLAEAQ